MRGDSKKWLLLAIHDSHINHRPLYTVVLSMDFSVEQLPKQRTKGSRTPEEQHVGFINIYTRYSSAPSPLKPAHFLLVCFSRYYEDNNYM